MKRLKSIILLVGLLLSNLTAWGQFDPYNPPEPAGSLRISLVAEPAEAGYFNYNKEVIAAEGESYYLCAYARHNYKFQAWEQDGKVISTSYSFNYLMGEKDVTLTARFVYSPENPPEPVIWHQLFLESDPVGAGTFNYSSGTAFAEGEQIYLRAYENNGYKLAYWYRMEGADTLKLSTDRYFNFTMDKEDVTLKAKFVYDPSNPGEPSIPDEKYYYIEGSSVTAEQGSTVNFPVYLFNSGNVSGIAFSLTLDGKITIDKEQAKLSSRCSSHTLQIDENEGSSSFRVTISGDQNIQGSSGVLLTIPLTVSSELTPGYYDIQFSNGAVTLPNGIEKESRTYNGGLYVTLAPKKMGAEDYAALCDMYHVMGGNNWSRSWDISSDMIDGSNWRGVTFANTHVSAIDLTACNVSGHIPASVLALSTLEKLNLSSNALDWNVKDLADTLSKYGVKPVVASLILKNNQLKGDVSVLAGAFPELKTLDLSENCFSELSQPLSGGISVLNIYSQKVPVENVQNMRLAVKQKLELPTIFTYSHADKTYKPVSYLEVYQENSDSYTWAYLNYISDSYEMTWYDWKSPSGSRFILKSGTQDTYGTTIPIIISFDKGDVNVDSAIDILDVQGTLNYIIGYSSFPFVYAAADVYEDTKLTVQDIVRIVDLVLEGAIPATTPVDNLSPMLRSEVLPSVRICVEDGKLVMYSDTEVAAADIVLNHCRQSQLRMLLNANQFQSVAKNKDSGVRLVIFSTAGEVLPAGRTVLAELSSAEAAVSYVDLADKQARRIPASISPTGVHSDVSAAVLVYPVGNNVFAALPDGLERLVVDVIGTDGCLNDQKVFVTPSAGTLQITSDLSSGIYLLRLQLETSVGVTYKSQKVVISK